MENIFDTAPEIIRDCAAPFRTKNGALCPTCQKHVKLMSIEQSADFYKTNIQDIKLLVRNVTLHPVHNNYGELMICNESLLAVFEKRPTQPLDPNYLSVSSIKRY